MDGERLPEGRMQEDWEVVSPRVEVEGLVEEDGLLSSPVEELEVDFDKALNISIGKSATPIIILPIVPSSADAPPEMGSHGPSSVSYSRGR